MSASLKRIWMNELSEAGVKGLDSACYLRTWPVGRGWRWKRCLPSILQLFGGRSLTKTPVTLVPFWQLVHRKSGKFAEYRWFHTAAFPRVLMHCLSMDIDGQSPVSGRLFNSTPMGSYYLSISVQPPTYFSVRVLATMTIAALEATAVLVKWQNSHDLALYCPASSWEKGQ